MKKVFRYILNGLMILATIAMIVILVQDMGSVKALIYIGIALAATVITVGLFLGAMVLSIAIGVGLFFIIKIFQPKIEDSITKPKLKI